MSKVRDIDKGFQELVRRANMSGEIKVGVFDVDAGVQHGEGVTVLEVAIWNEFGTDRIPERSFIRAWFDENADKCKEAVRKMAEGVIAGKYTAKQAKELLAQRFVGEIQKRIAAGIPPPNSPITIAMKGSDKPLIDTGQLRSSITYSVDGKLHPSEALKQRVQKQKDEAKAKRKEERAQKAALKREGKRIRKQVSKAFAGVTKSAIKGARRGGKQFLRKARKALRLKKKRGT